MSYRFVVLSFFLIQSASALADLTPIRERFYQYADEIQEPWRNIVTRLEDLKPNTNLLVFNTINQDDYTIKNDQTFQNNLTDLARASFQAFSDVEGLVTETPEENMFKTMVLSELTDANRSWTPETDNRDYVDLKTQENVYVPYLAQLPINIPMLPFAIAQDIRWANNDHNFEKDGSATAMWWQSIVAYPAAPAADLAHYAGDRSWNNFTVRVFVSSEINNYKIR
jgi:hypothetical protein